MSDCTAAQTMEIDAAADDDSDATVAGEDIEDLPAASEVSTSVSKQAHEAAAPRTHYRARGDEEAEPVSPSLLHRYTTSKSCLESQRKHEYVTECSSIVQS